VKKLTAALAAAALATGCAAENVDVTRVYTPADAAAQQAGAHAGMTPVAVVRGSERIPIPKDAHVEATRVVLNGQYVRKLADGDVIEQDDEGHITGVRTKSGEEIKFVPGTAVSPPDSDFVRGQLEGAHNAIELSPSDRIEMHGSFAPDVEVPGGGHVESTRSTGLLIAGGVMLAIAYLPSAYVGASSHLSDDRMLLVPVVGPWIDLATRPSCVPPPGSQMLPIDPCAPETASRWALVASGSLQGLGVVLGAFGLPARTRVVDADRGVGRGHGGVQAQIVPQPNGAAVVGTF
jgi:hypothetical protein